MKFYMICAILLTVSLSSAQDLVIQKKDGNLISVKVIDIDTITFTTLQSDTTLPPNDSTVIDIDGNIYKIIKIGDQVWMAENLKVTRYKNGEAIADVTDQHTWKGIITGAYCSYNNDEANIAVYGRLYNWYAVDDPRGLAPKGWHVPSDEEWKQLEMFLLISQSEVDAEGYRGTDQGGQLKEKEYAHWNYPNKGATDRWNFAALPGGLRTASEGLYSGIKDFAIFWSSTAYDSTTAWRRALNYSETAIARSYNSKVRGFSVRCVRDN